MSESTDSVRDTETTKTITSQDRPSDRWSRNRDVEARPTRSQDPRTENDTGRVNRHYTDDRQRGRGDNLDRWGRDNTDSNERRFPPRDTESNEPRRFERSEPARRYDDRPSRDERANRFDDSRQERPQRSYDDRNERTQRSYDDRSERANEERPAHLRFSRGGDHTAQRSGRPLGDIDREKSLSRDNITASPQPSTGSNDALSDFTARISLNERKPTATPVQPLQPVKLGKSENTQSFAERLAARKASGSSGERFEEAPRQDRYSDRFRSDEPRQQQPGSRFARDPNEERYGQRERQPYGAGRFGDESRGGSGYGSSRYGGSRDVGELPTGPSARNVDYASIEPPKPQPKKLAAAKAQTEIDPNTLSQRYDSDAVKLNVKEIPKTVNPLQNAIDSKTSISETELTQHINEFDLLKYNQQIADVIVRSIIDSKLTLAQAVTIIQQHVTAQSQQQTLITSILTSYVQRKDEGQLQQLVQNSKLDILSIIAPNMQGSELDIYLEKHNLLRLKPVADITEPVNSALSENKSASDILQIIDSNIDPKLTAANVRPAIVAYVSKQVFAKTGTLKTDILNDWTAVLKRIVLRAKDEQIAMISEFVSGWYGAGLPKQQLRDAFQLLYNNKVVSAESFKLWQENIKDRSTAKMKAILQIGGWLSELQASIKSDEVESENEEEEDDLAANPNLED